MKSEHALVKDAEPIPEYSVYIFHEPVHINDNHITWEKRHTTSSIQSAYSAARDLYNSRSYRRVEIKKNFFDRNLGKKICKTLEIYDKNEYKPVGLFVVSAAAFLVAAAGIFWLF